MESVDPKIRKLFNSYSYGYSSASCSVVAFCCGFDLNFYSVSAFLEAFFNCELTGLAVYGNCSGSGKFLVS